ncbi:MAG: DUF1579 domain-containing protein, partial [Acidobacteriota bacterium]|nr:DUF1579 domain-containing protein [Acidobacteriota bacterium]
LHPSPWDPAGGSATATVTNRAVLDGFVVVQEYEQRRGGQVTFRGHGVIWFDPARAEYVMHWWDSMAGIGGEYRGHFEGDTLRLGAPMPQGGHSRTSWTLTGPDAHVFLMEVSPDGETWHPAMEGQYRKAAPRAAHQTTAKQAAKTATAVKAAAGKTAAGKRRQTKAPARVPPKRGTVKKVGKARSTKALKRTQARKTGRRTTRR